MQQEQLSSHLLTREIKHKRQLALSEVLHLQSSLRLMRRKYKQGGWYEQQQIIHNARHVKDQLKKQTTQYKIHCKDQLDEYGKTVVDALF